MEREYSQKFLQINRGKRVIFSPSETPFTYIKPELTDLGENPALAAKLTKSFPLLSFGGAYTADGAIIIQDISDSEEITAQLRNLNDYSQWTTLQIVDASKSTEELLSLLENDEEIIDNPTLVFPGEGARDMERFLRLNLRSGFFIPTKRTMIAPGNFDLSIDTSSLPKEIESDWIVIFDDVVATGQTAATIAGALKRRYPSVKCAVATWIMVEPRNSEPSGIPRVDRTFVSKVIRGNYVLRPPINSFSCFVRNYGKYESVKNSFIQTYISDPQGFRVEIDKIGGNR